MSSTSEQLEKRRVANVARRYRREGYRVTIPNTGGSLPSFLGDHVPDLIAEADHDHVIVELRRAAALPGANDLVDLAARVEAQPGWRLELVALRDRETPPPPSETAIRSLQDEVAGLMEKHFPQAAFLYVWAAVEDIVVSIARAHRIDPAKYGFLPLAHQLVRRGLISQESFGRIEKAAERRNRLVHNGDMSAVAAADAQNLLALRQDLHEDLLLSAA